MKALDISQLTKVITMQPVSSGGLKCDKTS